MNIYATLSHVEESPYLVIFEEAHDLVRDRAGWVYAAFFQNVEDMRILITCLQEGSEIPVSITRDTGLQLERFGPRKGSLIMKDGAYRSSITVTFTRPQVTELLRKLVAFVDAVERGEA